MLICRKESLWQNSALRSQTSLERREPRRQASRITSTTNEKSLAKRRRQRLRASSRNSDTFPTPKRKRSPASRPTSSPSSSWITPTNGRPRPQRHGTSHAPRGLPDGRLHQQFRPRDRAHVCRQNALTGRRWFYHPAHGKFQGRPRPHRARRQARRLF